MRRLLVPFLLIVGIFGMAVAVHAASFATGVGLTAGSDCTGASLDITGTLDGTPTREYGLASNSSGTIYEEFEQPTTLADLSGTFVGYNYPGVNAPADTIIGLYAYVGQTPPSAADTVEWFVVYNCTTGEVLETCFGAYGTCAQTAVDYVANAPAAGRCLNLDDGRLNNNSARDCAAPVVLYLQPVDENGIGRLDIYGVGNGRSTLAVSIPSITYEIAPPANDKSLVEIVGNPNNNQPIGAYLMLDGTVLIETAYADGKPYVIRFDPDGAQKIIYVAW